jgi:hypothetical protein
VGSVRLQFTRRGNVTTPRALSTAGSSTASRISGGTSPRSGCAIRRCYARRVGDVAHGPQAACVDPTHPPKGSRTQSRQTHRSTGTGVHVCVVDCSVRAFGRWRLAGARPVSRRGIVIHDFRKIEGGCQKGRVRWSHERRGVSAARRVPTSPTPARTAMVAAGRRPRARTSRRAVDDHMLGILVESLHAAN